MFSINQLFRAPGKSDFFAFRKIAFSGRHQKRFLAALEKLFFLGTKKSDFFGFRKIAFSGRQEKLKFPFFMAP